LADPIIDESQIQSDTTAEMETVKLVYGLLNRSKKAYSKQRGKLRHKYDFVVDRKQWPKARPSYRHSLVLNFTFSIIQSIIPVMTDNRPRIDVMPTEPSDRDFANMLSIIIEDV
jgi:hypothetical protein